MGEGREYSIDKLHEVEIGNLVPNYPLASSLLALKLIATPVAQPKNFMGVDRFQGGVGRLTGSLSGTGWLFRSSELGHGVRLD